MTVTGSPCSSVLAEGDAPEAPRRICVEHHGDHVHAAQPLGVLQQVAVSAGHSRSLVEDILIKLGVRDL